MDPLEVDPRAIVDALAVTASELGEEPGGPTLLRHALVTDPGDDLLAPSKDLAALHQRWHALSGAIAGSGEEAGPSGGWRRITRRAERAMVALWRRQPDYELQREMLGELIRVVDALAKRSDELAQSLYEFETVVSEDLTRLSALVASAVSRADGKS